MMKVLIILAGLVCLGTAFQLSPFDPEACTTLPELPTPRVLNASTPILFDSPGFNYSDPEGSGYPPNTHCEWSIFMDDPDYDELQLLFFNFTTYYITDCELGIRGDYVEIYDGVDDTGTLLARLCGIIFNEDQQTYISTNKNFFVRFVTDDTGEREGWLARAGYTLENTACDPVELPQVYISPFGLFATQDYPVPYPNNENCEWHFQAGAGERVELAFLGFETEGSCMWDYIELFDGPSDTSPFMGRWYDVHIPARITSSGSDLYMTFTSDSSISLAGLLGAYQFV